MLKSNLDRMDIDTFHCAVLKSFSTIAKAETPVANIETEMNTLETKIIHECMDKEAVHEAVLQLTRLRTLKDLAAAYTTKTKIVSDEKLIIQFSELVNDSTVAMAQAVLELAVIVRPFSVGACVEFVRISLKCYEKKKITRAKFLKYQHYSKHRYKNTTKHARTVL